MAEQNFNSCTEFYTSCRTFYTCAHSELNVNLIRIRKKYEKVKT